MYTVTRQVQWPEGTNVVEISEGGIDYCNPDALSPKYSGEMEEYNNPIEAVNVAIEICKAWRKDGCKDASLGVGCTSGMTMPFETCTFRDARKWATETYEHLKKCSSCNEILGDEKTCYTSGFFTNKGEFISDEDYSFCSQNCAEKYSAYEETVDN